MKRQMGKRSKRDRSNIRREVRMRSLLDIRMENELTKLIARQNKKDTAGESGQTLLESQFAKTTSTHHRPTNILIEKRCVGTHERHPVNHQLNHVKNAQVGSLTRVTSMGGLYDAASLHAL